MSTRGKIEIAAHEGIVQMPYRDSVGVWTFGIGHTASAGAPDPAKMPRGEARPITEVMQVFSRDLKRFEDRERCGQGAAQAARVRFPGQL